MAVLAWPKSAPIKSIKYFSMVYGHLHTSALSASSGLTALSCGHPVKILDDPIQTKRGWKYVQVGPHKGFIKEDYLRDKRGNCLQAQYPKFFNYLDLDLTELYFWGRLYDQYVYGKSQVNKR